MALVSSYEGRYIDNFNTIVYYLLKFSHAIAKTRLLDYLRNGWTNCHKKWYDAMPHMTEHAPFHFNRFTLTSVKVCGKSYSKTDIRTVRLAHTHRRIVQNHFSTFRWLHIPNPFLSQTRFFPRCQYSMGHGCKNVARKKCVSLWVVPEMLRATRNRPGPLGGVIPLGSDTEKEREKERKGGEKRREERTLRNKQWKHTLRDGDCESSFRSTRLDNFGSAGIWVHLPWKYQKNQITAESHNSQKQGLKETTCLRETLKFKDTEYRSETSESCYSLIIWFVATNHPP